MRSRQIFRTHHHREWIESRSSKRGGGGHCSHTDPCSDANHDSHNDASNEQGDLAHVSSPLHFQPGEHAAWFDSQFCYVTRVTNRANVIEQCIAVRFAWKSVTPVTDSIAVSEYCLGPRFLSSGGKHVLPPVQERQSRSQTSGIQGADRSDQLQRLRLRAALGALPECCRAASHYLRLDRQQPRDHPARRIVANIAKLP